MTEQVAPEIDRMTMSEWAEIRNAVSGRLRAVSKIGAESAIHAAEALLAEGWVSPVAVRDWIAIEKAATAERIEADQAAKAEAYAARPVLCLRPGCTATEPHQH